MTTAEIETATEQVEAPLEEGWQRDYTLRSRIWEVFGLTLEELCTGHPPQGWV